MVNACMMRRRHWHARTVDVVVDGVFPAGRCVCVCDSCVLMGMFVGVGVSVCGHCERVGVVAGAGARMWMCGVWGCGDVGCVGVCLQVRVCVWARACMFC